MVNSTSQEKEYEILIYNSRNLYGQFDAPFFAMCSFIYNSRNLYGQFDERIEIEENINLQQ